jgi:hypothetical protein
MGKKVHETPSQWESLGMVVHACHPSNGKKNKMRSQSRPNWAKK